MPLEYEYVFRDYDKKDVITKIKNMNGKKFGHFIFRVIVFQHPDKENMSYIRIRDEGHKITMTLKQKSKTQFSDEYEIEIDNFETAEKMLYLLGCTKKYYYEKMREIWHLDNNDIEIVFDTTPGFPEIMEIECLKSKTKLDLLISKLELKDSIVDKEKSKPLTEELFGFLIPKTIPEITFGNVKKELSKYVVKNKKLFLQLVKENLEIYNSLKKIKK